MIILRLMAGMLGAALVLGADDRPDMPRDSLTARVVDDFESYEGGEPPSRWKFITSGREIWPLERVLDERERFYVVEENGNKFGRVFTKGEALRVSLRNGEEFDWNLKDRPRLQWRWRANKLPEGASEKDENDTGAALYVTFGSDWLGRPKSIKYSYSSSLPVGTVVSFGPLKVIVAESATEPRTGEWKIEQRDVIADYRQVFGGRPPDEPVSITLWSDSDTTNDIAEADFDDIKLLPPYR
jgi:hypothetical protein